MRRIWAAHASRVLAKPSRIRELVLRLRCRGAPRFRKSSFRRDAETRHAGRVRSPDWCRSRRLWSGGLLCSFTLSSMTTETDRPSDFIRDIVEEDLRTGKYKQIITRFPPEPNGYLHIGHAKSICLNFGIAREFGGICNIRMDDTNPTKEEAEYVRSIMVDVHWLIDGWADKRLGGAPFYASDYFDRFYEYAAELIRKGKAYVDDMSREETDEYRRLGKPSNFRDRSRDESLDLFARMKAGEFPDGARTLRAKIDVNAANVWLRDPVLYRIRHASHHRTGDKWCIYPMYDWAHTLSDHIEGITHSICTLEFEVHRPLYDWILDALEVPEPRPHQYEFARFNSTYAVMSKRKLIQLVNEQLVNGWDDPRMLTISGLRRRGVTASALRSFAYNIGITKYPSMTDVAVLDHTVRDELNRTATRRLAVLRPIKVVLTNYPEEKTEEIEAINNPENPNAGTRKIPFSRELYIEQDDFMEAPPPKYFRLRPGGEVRLKYAYIIKCEEVVKNSAGTVTEIRCSIDLDSKSGGPTAGRKVKGTIHWVSAPNAIDADVRLYDRLFTVPEPDAGGDFKSFINSNSLEVAKAKCEPALANASPEERYQFERLGYFTLDPDSTSEKQVWNRTATLRDAWAKAAK